MPSVRHKLQPLWGDTKQPPFALPSMAEVNAVPFNGLTAVSCFSGCGGSSLGYRMAGIKVLWANEFIASARDCYSANFPETILDGRDIRDIQPADILDGSPPCASFSMAGSRDANWGKIKRYSETKQRTDDLAFVWLRLAVQLRPKVLIMENVPGLKIGKARAVLDQILGELWQSGYRPYIKIISCASYGVPQMRRRLIIQAWRADLGIGPVWPFASVLEPYTTSDALSWTKGEPVEPETSIERYSLWHRWPECQPGRNHDRLFNLSKPALDRPCFTLTANCALPNASSVVHPIERRKMSIAELKAIQSFPKDFVLCGSYRQQAERIGRSVPPLMMRALAMAIAQELRKWKERTA